MNGPFIHLVAGNLLFNSTTRQPLPAFSSHILVAFAQNESFIILLVHGNHEYHLQQ